MTALRQYIRTDLSYTAARLRDDQWHRILDGFQDASIFQTVPFSAAKSSSEAIEHLVVRRGDTAVAAAQVRLFPVPLTGISIAYVLWGPVFHRYGSHPDWVAFGEALRALRQEYVINRRGSLRVRVGLSDDANPESGSVFKVEGYRKSITAKKERTIIIDLEHSLGDLRRGLHKKWRNCLNAAEKSGLRVTEGVDDAMFEPFLDVYRQMLSRKRLADTGDLRSFRAIQKRLPIQFKMNIIVAWDKGQPSAGAICSAIGRRGIYLFGATADIGLKNKSSYLVQWRAIQWLKEMQCTEYDLHGINPHTSPGVHVFKAGLAGKNGREVEFVGNCDAHAGVGSQFVLKAADWINDEYKKLKNLYGKYFGVLGIMLLAVDFE